MGYPDPWVKPKEYTVVRSLTLLKHLFDKGLTSFPLRKVMIGVTYRKTVFVFKKSEAIEKAIAEWELAGGANNPEFDDPELWEGFEEDWVIGSPRKVKCLYSTNPSVLIDKLIKNNLGKYVVGMFWNKKARRGYHIHVVVDCPEARKILGMEIED